MEVVQLQVIVEKANHEKFYPKPQMLFYGSIQLFSIYVLGLCLLNLNIGLIIFLFC
jgi:hypothetical protein